MPYTALLMDVKRFAVHDGPGIRTTLFLKGCPLHCIWCHNPEGINAKAEMACYQHKCLFCGECTKVCPSGAHDVDGKHHHFYRDKCITCGACEEACLGEAMKRFGQSISVDEALRIVLEDRCFYQSTNGGVTVSGGEPLMHANFVRELFALLHREKINTAIDTCGCVGWGEFEKILSFTDVFLYDIKHIDTQKHRELTGHGNELILDNLKRLSLAGKRIEIRMPFVPGCNTDDNTIRRIGEFLSEVHIEKMKVLPYHSLARSKYLALGKNDTMPEVTPPTDEMLHHAVDILRECGVNAVS